ncbi:glutamate--tRNA ligase [Candidatus Woesearchaeota archaeon]|nr:glutamate--tRNA ligase [Candidatus Woesearchaeota archaeon]
MSIDREIRNFALENAVRFNGRANVGAVIGKIIGAHPELKKDMKSLSQKVSEAINKVNSLPLKKQKEELEKNAPELLIKDKKAKQKELPELKDAVMGKVVTRLPPEPSKYNHIGHALSFLINYLYAKKYKGKCLLKFEDTNPEKCTKEYAEAMEDDIMNYLGIKPDKIVYISDDMGHMYQKAEEMIIKGKAYVCFCKREKMQDLRHKGKACKCRNNTVMKNNEFWHNMINKKYKDGECTLRLKGDMKSNNHAMRDPVLFRISYALHFRHKNKYCAWPLYDFENAVEDCNYKVTHVLRSIEFGKMREELQNFIKNAIGCKPQIVKEYGRYNIRGAVTQGRVIRKLIEEGKVSGWDDPSLVTLKALKRRGIVKETYYKLVEEVGLSPAGSNIDWTIISAINRSILDKKAERFFFVENPVKIKIQGAPKQRISINLHPEDTARGSREFVTHEDFFISSEDLDGFEESKLNRLMDCMNFVKKDKFIFDSLEYNKFKKHGHKIVQWVIDEHVKVKVRMPDNTYKVGIGEKALHKLDEGAIVQFTRFGFCKLDQKHKDELEFWFTHK